MEHPRGDWVWVAAHLGGGGLLSTAAHTEMSGAVQSVQQAQQVPEGWQLCGTSGTRALA